jgi:hypothetical protein
MAQDGNRKPVAAVSYNWKNVQMVGGGFVDGVVFHPKVAGLRYCRTDIGGAYRWDDHQKKWQPLMDWVSYENKNLMGVESIAIDPQEPNFVYLACGTYTSSPGPNAILLSNDRGKTFKQVNVPFRMGGNENGRGNGERLVVDPNDSNTLYMGTRLDGLWCSKDKGLSWNKVNSFPLPVPAVNTPVRPGFRSRANGIVFVLFDGRSGSKGKGSNTLYAGVSVKGQNSMFYSCDKGETWQAIPGQPTQLMPTRAVLAAEGTMYIAYGSSPGPDRMTNGGIWKLDTHTLNWADITPVKPDSAKNKLFGYAAVAIDANHPGGVIASTFNRYGDAGGEDIFRSIDGGKSWKPVFTAGGNGYYDYTIAPYVEHTGIHWLFDIEIDPFNSNHALFTTGYGGQETFDLTDVDKGKPTKWQNMCKGIEETVSLDLLSPPQGVPLVSAIGDYGGFVHYNLDASPTAGNSVNPRFANTDAVACAELNPNIMVRVGQGATPGINGNIGYSLDGGKSWQPPASTPQPNSKRGYICVSADGKIWIWSAQNSQVYFTKDNGATWLAAKGLPANAPVAADRVNPNRFYSVDMKTGNLLTSDNGGSEFKAQKLNVPESAIAQSTGLRDAREASNRIYTTPGKEGDIWLAAFYGLYHSANGGTTFSKTGDADLIHGFGFGKAALGSSVPELFIIAAVNGVNGIYRSDDMAKTWLRINDDKHQWGLLLNITGDPKLYGRVYLGTHGRGIVYGDPIKVKTNKNLN